MDSYAGCVQNVRNWKEHCEWADVIVFDDVGFGVEAEGLRRRGKPVVGGSRYADRLEEDRAFGQAEMSKACMTTLRHQDFRRLDEAIKFLERERKRYVLKPSGYIESDQKDLVFVAESEIGADLIEFLRHNRDFLSEEFTMFQLQEFVEGVEIAVGAFFNGRQFLTPINVNFEHKRLFPGEIGPLTGEMGTLMFWCNHNAIFDATLAKMTKRLSRSGYVGYVDINCIVNADGVFPLELTCRFGYPTISVQSEGLACKIGEFLLRLSRGEHFELSVKPGFQVGIVVAVPPFPYYDKRKLGMYRNLPIRFKNNNLKGFHLGDVKLVDNTWCVAGDSGYVLVITGNGKSVRRARQQAYSRVRNILLQGCYYRGDIGARWNKDVKWLKRWGYLPPGLDG